MPETLTPVRKQGLLLNGDDILDPSLFKGDNGDATIKGISATASGAELWSIRVGGTGRSQYTDQELLIYDAGTNTVKSAGISLTRWNQLVMDVALMGPLFTDRVDATVQGGVVNSTTYTKVGEVTLLLPSNCQWRWIRVEFAGLVTHNDGANGIAGLQVWLNNATSELGSWSKMLPATLGGINWVNGGGVNTMSWTLAADGAVTDSGLVGLSSLKVALAVSMPANGAPTIQAGGTLKVTGWYKRTAVAAAASDDPNEVPVPGNFTATNFQLRMPGSPTPNEANLETVDPSFVYDSGSQTMINWGPAEAYNYALKVLYTLEKKNGASSTQINQARDWLQNVYLPNTSAVGQVTGYMDPWVFGNMHRYPVGTGTVEGVFNLTQIPPTTGNYQRNFALQTFPYVAA